MSELTVDLVKGHNRKISSTTEFKEITKIDAQNQLSAEIEKLKKTAPPGDSKCFEEDLRGFQNLFRQYLHKTGPSLEWEKIEPLPVGAILPYESLPVPEDNLKIKQMLDKLIVIKLNGGLGTSMGCVGPKSVITVRSDLTFLDLTVQQIEYLNKKYEANVPLVLMNSFNTDADTLKVLRKYGGFKVKIYSFLQSRYPRINKESLLPTAVSLTELDDEDWYPPGHGDLYDSFMRSGLLKFFIDEGREYCFVSNIDNLGATVDLNILNMLINQTQKPIGFVMEVTDKTVADVKGGTLINYQGKLRLLEIAQVPNEHTEEFKSVKKFKIFNTNNLWMRLSQMHALVSGGGLNMEIIVNHKLTDKGLKVIQLETASGAAMKDFENSIGINVPRTRFLPVKKTQDLLLVMSNLYELYNGALTINHLRAFPTVPLVKLGSQFTRVRDFLNRFEGMPDILELDHLTVSGDVTFGRGVSLRGTVIIIANHGDRIDIPSGAILENKIVSGNLRILSH